MKQYRILQSLATLNRGGAETMIMNMYRHIDREKIQFDFVINEREKPYEFEKEIRALGGKIYTTPKFNGRNYFEFNSKWKKLFRKNNEWDIIHIHNSSSANFIIDVAKKFDLTTVVHSHFANANKSLLSKIKTVARLPIKYKSDYLLACSKKAGAFAFNIKENDVNVLNNAIETDKFIFDNDIRKMKRKELGLTDETIIGHVGRLSTEKNHYFLVDIYKEYFYINPHSKLILVGDGEIRKNIEEQVKLYNLNDNVIFLGNRDDVNQILQIFDIFIMPSIFEGLPVTLIEAQAAGLPIIASDTITNEVKISNLVNFKSIDIDPVFWAKEINSKLVENRKNMQEEIVQAGFDIQGTAEKLQNYYLNIIKSQN